jgi:peroxiredoxin
MKNSLILILILYMSLNTFGCDKDENSRTLKSENISANINVLAGDEKAAEFSLKSVDGKIVKLSDYKGKVVVVDFWATWCPPCRKGIPDLISIQSEFKKDVVVIGISLDQDKTLKDVGTFIKKYGINYPVVYGDEKVSKDYGNIQAIPTSFVIDKNGNIVDKHVGLVSKDTYVNKIKELLK